MGWFGGVWTEGTTCEDAPCCGCCGTNLYGSVQEDPDDFYEDDDTFFGEDDEEDYDDVFESLPEDAAHEEALFGAEC